MNLLLLLLLHQHNKARIRSAVGAYESTASSIRADVRERIRARRAREMTARGQHRARARLLSEADAALARERLGRSGRGGSANERLLFTYFTTVKEQSLTVRGPYCAHFKWLALVPNYISRSGNGRFISRSNAKDQRSLEPLLIHRSQTPQSSRSFDRALDHTRKMQLVNCGSKS
ncbi:hypothetical protein PRIPAC_70461 [Pristionchus pacificus]|uniref:Uncharacterized protein n=1 Tax=Pristionchus pacificus TaxID=54126 RepID=A0A2A6C7D3_PRIPA|nr:hypothetical protein PRIPAC_70461 [Pristionchus pacificus]|eukprot:PDM73978.1 hypothetical protein PRIPAC_41334 [Pristionchus pacificus]